VKLTPEQWSELRGRVAASDQEAFQRTIEAIVVKRERERRDEQRKAEQARRQAQGRVRPWIPIQD
jgi:hypothetical protein